jgi:uncharacterized membrane protein
MGDHSASEFGTVTSTIVSSVIDVLLLIGILSTCIDIEIVRSREELTQLSN